MFIIGAAINASINPMTFERCVEDLEERYEGQNITKERFDSRVSKYCSRYG